MLSMYKISANSRADVLPRVLKQRQTRSACASA